MSQQRQPQRKASPPERKSPAPAAEAAVLEAEPAPAPAAPGSAYVLRQPSSNQTIVGMRQSNFIHLQRRLGNSALNHLLTPAPPKPRALLQRAPALEDLVAKAEEQVTDAEIAQQQVEPDSAAPVSLPDGNTVAGGDESASGAPGGAAPAQESAAPAPADKTAVAPAPEAEAPVPAAPTTPTAEQAKAAPAPVAAAQPAAAPPAAASQAATPTGATAAAPEATAATQGAEATATGATAAAPEATAATQGAEATATGAQPAAGAERRPEEEEQRPQLQRLVQRKIAPKSPGEDPGFQAVVGQVQGASTQQKAHEPPALKADQAAAAAQMPSEEREGLAQGQQTAEVATAAAAQQSKAAGGQAPGFNKAAFIASVGAKIDQLTPKDPKQMENIEGSGVFSGAKQVVDTEVKTGKEVAQGDVDDKVEAAPDTAAVPERATTPLAPNQPGAAPIGNGSGAAPKAKGAEEVEAPLQAESQQLDTQMAQANVTEAQIQESNEPQFQSALATKNEAQASVTTDPVAYRAGEQSTVEGAQTAAGTTTQTGLTGMSTSRTQVFGQMDGVQTTAKGSDEAKRAEIGRQIDGIYESAKADVERILGELDTKVDQEFNSGADTAKARAVEYINRETEAFKDRRYKRDAAWYDVGSHVVGAVTQAWDTMGMPEEYYKYYTEGRKMYCDEMTIVIGRVADIVADHLGRAKQRIEDGRKQIDTFVASQPAALRQVAQDAADAALSKFTDLEQTVDAKQQEIVDNLAQQYVDKLQALDSELEAMKEKDKGWLEKAADAISGTINTIRELSQLLMSTLQRAASAVDQIIKHPVEFLGNLIAGVKLGLTNFVSNIGTHLQQGLISWLTGALGSAGITLPATFDLPGIFSLVMQILGLTWEHIRSRIVKGLGPKGEQIMGALEQAFNIIKIISTQGLSGLWEFVKGMIGDLKTMVLDQIKEMVITQVIQAGIDWLIGILGGPAGAFIKAVQGIVRVVTWFIENGARMMALVNSVLDSVTAIAAGNIGGAASYIEQTLAKALPTVISFLADLLGLGGISKKVQEIIKAVQKPINTAIDWVIQKALAIGKTLMGALGGKRGKKGEDAEKDKRFKAGVSAVQSLPGQSQEEMGSSLSSINGRYGFDELEYQSNGENWTVSAVMRKVSLKKKISGRSRIVKNDSDYLGEARKNKPKGTDVGMGTSKSGNERIFAYTKGRKTHHYNAHRKKWQHIKDDERIRESEEGLRNELSQKRDDFISFIDSEKIASDRGFDAAGLTQDQFVIGEVKGGFQKGDQYFSQDKFTAVTKSMHKNLDDARKTAEDKGVVDQFESHIKSGSVLVVIKLVGNAIVARTVWPKLERQIKRVIKSYIGKKYPDVQLNVMKNVKIEWR